MLPDFELKCLKAVQSAGGGQVGFSDWFEALDYMKDEISNVFYAIDEFDQLQKQKLIDSGKSQKKKKSYYWICK